MTCQEYTGSSDWSRIKHTGRFNHIWHLFLSGQEGEKAKLDELEAPKCPKYCGVIFPGHKGEKAKLDELEAPRCLLFRKIKTRAQFVGQNGKKHRLYLYSKHKEVYTEFAREGEITKNELAAQSIIRPQVLFSSWRYRISSCKTLQSMNFIQGFRYLWY